MCMAVAWAGTSLLHRAGAAWYNRRKAFSRRIWFLMWIEQG